MGYTLGWHLLKFCPASSWSDRHSDERLFFIFNFIVHSILYFVSVREYGKICDRARHLRAEGESKKELMQG
jgi:hypothetical protein